MRETVIQVDSSNPVEIFGPNNANISLLRKSFPKVKLVVRGNNLKAVGADADLIEFERKVKHMMDYFNRYNKLTTEDIENILNRTEDKTPEARADKDIIVFGTGGNIIKAKTVNQKRMVSSIQKNDMVFAVGPAGTGKSYTAVALAVKALKEREVRRIILTRPAVEAGEHLGFLPGDLKEKLDPYLQPLYDALHDMIPGEKLRDMMDNGVIQIAPLAFMRGRTLDNAFVILDEAQNATNSQLKMFLTRMGKSAKFMITGDVTQIDLPKSQQSGLNQAIDLLKGIKGIEFIFLDEQDAVRHRLVKNIVEKYASLKNTKNPKT